MKWRRVGTESYEEEVLLTRIGRKPPRYRMEHVRDDGKVMAAMLIKAPKGQRGYHVILDGEGQGYQAPTRRKALIAFREMHKTLEQAAPISDEFDKARELYPKTRIDLEAVND